MKYDIILFDLDETLLDFHGAQKQCIRRVFDEVCGSPENVDFETFYINYREINSSLWKLIEKGQMTKDRLRKERFERTFEHFNIKADALAGNDMFIQALSETVCLIPGAVEVLEKLKPQARLAIITNGFKEVQYKRMRGAKIDHFFEVIVTSDEVGVAKPQLGIFEAVFEGLGNPEKSRALIIGDKVSADVMGGQNYGIATCWFNHENLANEMPEVQPDYEIKHISELLDIVGAE